MPRQFVPKVYGRQMVTPVVAGPLTTCKMDLFTAPSLPTPDNVLADYTVAAYTGYSQQAIAAFGTPFLDSAGNGATGFPSKSFAGPSSGAGASVFGAIITDTAGTGLVLVIVFDAPIAMNTAADVITLTGQIAAMWNGTVVVTGSGVP